MKTGDRPPKAPLSQLHCYWHNPKFSVHLFGRDAVSLGRVVQILRFAARSRLASRLWHVANAFGFASEKLPSTPAEAREAASKCFVNDCLEEVALELELSWGPPQAAHHVPSIPKRREDMFHGCEILRSSGQVHGSCTRAPGHDHVFLLQVLYNVRSSTPTFVRVLLKLCVSKTLHGL